jgi:phospholipid/cholesterol/gamma-HCH transport system ATP-binding protein
MATKKPAAAEPIVELRDVCVEFGPQWVLRNVSLQVPKGQTLAIIGESGCGKTVLLKTILGLQSVTGGEVLFQGKRLADLDDKQLTAARTKFGFVFQNAALFDSMSIADNVAFPLVEHRRGTRDEAYQLVRERLAEVGLPPGVMVKKPAELSGGMRKRVGLARALAMRPEVLLYDEPTTGLDPIMSDVINELIIRTRKKYSVTSIIVTHDMHSALKVADRLVMLFPVSRLEPDESQIIFDGTPQEAENSSDERVSQFVRGEAGKRIDEMDHQLQAIYDSSMGG